MRHAISGGANHVTQNQHPIRKRVSAVALCAALFVFVSGCSSVTYESPSGGKFTRRALGNKTELSSLDVEAQTNGLPILHLKGYKNDQSQSTEAIAAGITQGIIKATSGK